MVVRIPLAAIGSFIGFAAGLSLALVVGALLCTPNIALVRMLALGAAAAGGGVGFATANMLATGLFRARFLEERVGARLPAARAIVRR